MFNELNSKNIVEQGIAYFNVKMANPKYKLYHVNDNAKKRLLNDCINETWLSCISYQQNKLNTNNKNIK